VYLLPKGIHQEILLLANANRPYAADGTDSQYTAEGLNIRYVADRIHATMEIGGLEKERNVDVITPLTKDAAQHPVIPFGADGSLDFATGELVLPGGGDIELNINEISARWLIEQLQSGSIHVLRTDLKQTDAFSLRKMNLSDGVIVEGISEAEEVNGLKRYWLGGTPETVQDPDQPLFWLIVDEETDELLAFRTSKRMLEEDGRSKETAMAIFTDSMNGWMNAGESLLVFYDSSTGDSTVSILSNAPVNREQEMADRMRIVLRGVRVNGSAWPAYSARDRYLVMAECRNGRVNVLDGLYTASYDGNTFESPYTRITGISEEEIRIIPKSDISLRTEQTNGIVRRVVCTERYIITGEESGKDENPGDFQHIASK
jgi:hypothetical protein